MTWKWLSTLNLPQMKVHRWKSVSSTLPCVRVLLIVHFEYDLWRVNSSCCLYKCVCCLRATNQPEACESHHSYRQHLIVLAHLTVRPAPLILISKSCWSQTHFSYFPERLERVSSNCSLLHLGNVDSSNCCLSRCPLSIGLYQKVLSSRRCPTESCALSEMQLHPCLTLTHFGGRRNQWFCCIATMMYITPLLRLCCSFWPRQSAGRNRQVGPQLYCYIWCSLSLCGSPQLVAWQLSALGNLIRLCAKAVQLLAVPWRVVS